MMDHLNNASVDQSLNGFDGGLAKQRINEPIQCYMLLNFICCVPLFY
jgi:hypothetical protein